VTAEAEEEETAPRRAAGSPPPPPQARAEEEEEAEAGPPFGWAEIPGAGLGGGGRLEAGAGAFGF
jgi:hypothetical protein